LRPYLSKKNKVFLFGIELPELFLPVNNKNRVLLPIGCEKKFKGSRIEGVRKMGFRSLEPLKLRSSASLWVMH
jgi:hypothetical protein